MKRVLAVAVTSALVLALPAAGQDEDPLVRELRALAKDLGNQRKIARNPKFQQSRQSWPRYERQLAQALPEQDRVVAGPREQIDEALTLARTRAGALSEPVDCYLYGRLLGLVGNLDEAHEQFKLAIAADNFFYWAWDGLGVYHTNKKNWEAATECFRRALQINPDFTKAVFGLAQCYIRNQDYAAAALKLNELIASSNVQAGMEEERQARLLLAEVYRSQQDYGRCIDELTRLADAGASDFRVFAMRAFCNKRLERWADAARDYEKILELAPGDNRFYLQLAGCYVRLGRNADAVHEYERGLRSMSDVSAETRGRIEAEIERLRKRPSREKPDKKRLSFEDWVNRLLHSPDVDRRRKAALVLARAPRQLGDETRFRELIGAFSNALKDKDPIVVSKALQQLCSRLPGQPEVLKLASFFLQHPDKRVRGMACHMMRNWPAQEIVPYLIKTMRDETDPYVFGRIHDTLNSKTLSWIERVLPEELEPEDIVRVREEWAKWYAKHRDVYRRFEPEGF